MKDKDRAVGANKWQRGPVRMENDLVAIYSPLQCFARCITSTLELISTAPIVMLEARHSRSRYREPRDSKSSGFPITTSGMTSFCDLPIFEIASLVRRIPVYLNLFVA